ncbi:MAG: hypothetical protein IJW45_01580 [Oscillospiraceae bacterium]|nr:hypothetical protein [Oscillospiraceae bacterium]
MDELEEKLNAVMNDPQMLQKLMTVAQSLGGQNAPRQEPKLEGLPDIDLGMLQKLSGFAKQGSIDKDQQALLRALSPYLSRDRISKLEKAMRAAKMARMASTLLGTGGQ